jgi:hypothetical protein
MARRHDSWTAARRETFLEVLAQTANVTAACAAVAKNKSGAYALRRRDAVFARRWDDAIDTALDQLVAVAVERVMFGTVKMVVRGSGEPVAIREYSDRLLMFLLSHRRPNEYARLAGPRVTIEEERDACRLMARRIADIEGGR